MITPTECWEQKKILAGQSRARRLTCQANPRSSACGGRLPASLTDAQRGSQHRAGPGVAHPPVSGGSVARLLMARARCILVTMNATVAVALITALSTLAAVGISGTIALLVNRSQAKTQHMRDKRQIRRDAYMQFLNQASIAEYELEKCWTSDIPANATPNRFINEAFTAIAKLDSMLNIVALEGPNSVEDASRDLRVEFIGELARISEAFDLAKGHGSLMRNDRNDDFGGLYLARNQSKRKLIERARQAMNDDSN